MSLHFYHSLKQHLFTLLVHCSQTSINLSPSWLKNNSLQQPHLISQSLSPSPSYSESHPSSLPPLRFLLYFATPHFTTSVPPYTPTSPKCTLLITAAYLLIPFSQGSALTHTKLRHSTSFMTPLSFNPLTPIKPVTINRLIPFSMPIIRHIEHTTFCASSFISFGNLHDFLARSKQLKLHFLSQVLPPNATKPISSSPSTSFSPPSPTIFHPFSSIPYTYLPAQYLHSLPPNTSPSLPTNSSIPIPPYPSFFPHQLLSTPKFTPILTLTLLIPYQFTYFTSNLSILPTQVCCHNPP